MPKLIRVFIAEDSPTTRALLKTALQKASDMEVVGEADNGTAVVGQVENLKPDLVLMDIGLVGMNGLDACKILKNKVAGLRIIMVTSNDDETAVFDAFSSGADGYYLKSNTTDQLLTAVRSVGSGAAWLHPAIAGKVLKACVSGADKLVTLKQKSSSQIVQKVSRQDPVCRLVHLARDLEKEARLEDAEAALEGAIALCEQLSGPADQEVATLVTMFADLLYAQEKFVRAERLYLRALELRHQELGYENKEVAACLEDLANLYDTRSNYAEAEHYYYWSYKIRKKICGPEDPLTEETCAKLAWVLRAQEKHDLANEIEKRSKD